MPDDRIITGSFDHGHIGPGQADEILVPRDSLRTRDDVFREEVAAVGSSTGAVRACLNQR